METFYLKHNIDAVKTAFKEKSLEGLCYTVPNLLKSAESFMKVTEESHLRNERQLRAANQKIEFLQNEVKRICFTSFCRKLCSKTTAITPSVEQFSSSVTTAFWCFHTRQRESTNRPLLRRYGTEALALWITCSRRWPLPNGSTCRCPPL
jgi:hypothetical protein